MATATDAIPPLSPLSSPPVCYVRGALVHAPTRGTIELLPDAFVRISATTGRIEVLHREIQPEDVALLQTLAGTKQTDDAVADVSAVPATTIPCPAATAASVRVLAPHEFLMPGFVDTHVHAPQYVFAGTATDTPLMEWLTKYTFPVEQAFADLAFAREWYTKLLDRLLAEGITTAQYFATIHVAATQLFADLIEVRGQRAFVGLVSMDRNAPTTYVSPSAQHALADAETFVEFVLAKQSALVQPVVTPRFVPTCSRELLHGLGALAARYGGLRIQSHAAESLDEEAFVAMLHPGQRDTELFVAAQLLTARTCMAHSVHLTDAELDQFALAGASIAHCPLSNFFFANGFLDVAHALDRGVAIGLGTDIAGGYAPSMLRAIQTCVLTAKVIEIQNQNGRSSGSNRQRRTSAAAADDEHSSACRSTGQDPGLAAHASASTTAVSVNSGSDALQLHSLPPTSSQQEQRQPIDYKDAFWLATMGGAAALGLERDIGSFAVGKCFDAILVDAHAGSHVDIATRDEPLDIVQKLLHNGDSRNFREVFVNGRTVHRQRVA